MSHKTATKPLEIVPGISHIYRRGARYYFRMAVPEPLRRIVGKRELVESLNTSNFAEAKRLLPERIYRAHVVLDTAKLRTSAGAGGSGANPKRPAPWHRVIFPPPLPPELPDGAKAPSQRELPRERPQPLVVTTEDQAQEIARRHFVELERETAKSWSESLGTLSGSELQELKASLRDDRESLEGNPESGHLHPSQYDNGQRAVWRYLERHNLTVKPDSPEISTLSRLFREAELEHIRRQEDRVHGNPFRTYSSLFHDLSERSALPSAKQGMTLATLCGRFIAEREKAHKAPKTQHQTQVAANLLLELFGSNTEASAISRDDAERFCAVMETIPKNRRQRYPGLSIAEAIEAAWKSGDTQGLDFTTRRNRFFSAFQIFGYGVAIRELRENPFDDELLKRRCTPPQKHTEQVKNDRPAFEIEELNRIFSVPPFNSELPPQDRTARFWVPLICLFHGTRQSEICHSLRKNFTVAAQKCGVPEDRINRICGWSSGYRQQRDCWLVTFGRYFQ